MKIYVVCDGGCGLSAPPVLTNAGVDVPDGWFRITTLGPPQLVGGGGLTLTQLVLDPVCFSRVGFPLVAVPGAAAPLPAVPSIAKAAL